ncbi:hypothetical protein K432DRAFT_384723 [Lepidopterella palustris CBS 459.81]|uniref:Uncharacterized protein n=1 Tax=Lepidopterella palustris CBS 459.81 TaxID=1314670 RepID=A0A8E2E4Y0_9PEZI|nr:hypothetical protein K432DRAFT_384723 [Lepidopterella palustris CBS 459.81]
MAVGGTSIPNAAGIQCIVPSVPRPDQKDPLIEFSQANPASANDYATDIPRGVRDHGQTVEAITDTGDQLPSSIEKNLDDAGCDPREKSHDQ